MQVVRRLHARAGRAVVELDVRPEPPLRAFGPVLGDGVDGVLLLAARSLIETLRLGRLVGGLESVLDQLRIDGTQRAHDVVAELVHGDVLAVVPRARQAQQVLLGARRDVAAHAARPLVPVLPSVMFAMPFGVL